MVEAEQNYFLKRTDPAVPENGNQIILPSDTYKIRLLERVEGDAHFPVYEKSLAEASQNYTNQSWYEDAFYQNLCFVLFPDYLAIYPERSVAGIKFRLSYVRDPRTVSNESMQTTWERYISYKTAYLITLMEENPRAGLDAEAIRLSDQMKAIASQRTQGPRVIQPLDRLENHRLY